ncbi:hypothetical protein PIB30_052414 [Stylosanthes scabra]|uniref:Uncharacterized protein n=1 Tax=Stylosanthes scabra TaxID=79078 RepID=A0ABU6RIK9_9FABA|nr:hypothetical protein [Stylosanthes scabra]
MDFTALEETAEGNMDNLFFSCIWCFRKSTNNMIFGNVSAEVNETFREVVRTALSGSRNRGLSLAEKISRLVAGGEVNPYPNVLGIYNSRGPRYQQNSSKSRVTRKNSPVVHFALSLSHLRSPHCWKGRSVNSIEINSVPPIRCP